MCPCSDGVVYRAEDTLGCDESGAQSKKLVALKKVKLQQEEDGLPCTALREVSVLRELKHENVIRCVPSPDHCVPSKICH